MSDENSSSYDIVIIELLRSFVEEVPGVYP